VAVDYAWRLVLNVDGRSRLSVRDSVPQDRRCVGATHEDGWQPGPLVVSVGRIPGPSRCWFSATVCSGPCFTRPSLQPQLARWSCVSDLSLCLRADFCPASPPCGLSPSGSPCWSAIHVAASHILQVRHGAVPSCDLLFDLLALACGVFVLCGSDLGACTPCRAERFGQEAAPVPCPGLACLVPTKYMVPGLPRQRKLLRRAPRLSASSAPARAAI
jgi:hypothetical protein